MASRQKAYGVDRIDADGYDPDIVDGAVVGEFHQLEPSGSTAAALDACVWRSDPATYDYLFEKDEAFLVVEGAADGRPVRYRREAEPERGGYRLFQRRHAFGLDRDAALQEVHGHRLLTGSAATASSCRLIRRQVSRCGHVLLRPWGPAPSVTLRAAAGGRGCA